MRIVIKFVLYALVVLLLVSWITTVMKSCGKEGAEASNAALYDSYNAPQSEAEEALVNELLESAKANSESSEAPAGTPQISSIDYSKRLDPDEEAMLEKVTEKKSADKGAGTQGASAKTDVDKPKSTPVKTTSGNTSRTSAKAGSPSGGNYYVIAGAFGQESNAEAQQKRLKSLGYSHAEVVKFDGASVYSVISGRYAGLESANAVAAELKSRHKVDCYVKKRED